MEEVKQKRRKKKRERKGKKNRVNLESRIAVSGDQTQLNVESYLNAVLDVIMRNEWLN